MLRAGYWVFQSWPVALRIILSTDAQMVKATCVCLGLEKKSICVVLAIITLMILALWVRFPYNEIRFSTCISCMC